MNPALCVLRKCNWGVCVLQTRFARVGVFQAVAAAGRGIMGRPLLPAATQGQTRLSLLGLSNIPRWTICPGIPNWRQGAPKIGSWFLRFGEAASRLRWAVWGVAPALQFKDRGSRLSPSLLLPRLRFPDHCASLKTDHGLKFAFGS